MSSAQKNLSSYDEQNMPSAQNFKFGIVVAEWNTEVTHALYSGCYETLVKHGALPENIFTAQVPGTFELPVAARMLDKANKLDCVICLGCVVKGETSHNEYINNSVAIALQNLGITTGRAFIFGILTPNDQEQALDRAGGKYGNKGIEAATTAIRMAELYHNLLTASKKNIGFN